MYAPPNKIIINGKMPYLSIQFSLGLVLIASFLIFGADNILREGFRLSRGCEQLNYTKFFFFVSRTHRETIQLNDCVPMRGLKSFNLKIGNIERVLCLGVRLMF